MAGAIFLAIGKRYDAHRWAQTLLFAVTLGMVLLFEIGVRLSGGFAAYADQSGIPFGTLVTLLAIHILIAVAAVGLWAWLAVDSLRRVRAGGSVSPWHKQYGRTVFAGMSITSFLGVMIYWLLFIA